MGTQVVDPQATVITSCPANIRETKIAWGYKPQTDIVTKNTDPELWSLTKTNPETANVAINTETDAQDIGKGDEFASQIFPTSVDTSVPITKYTNSQLAAWALCFDPGKATKTTAGKGFKYDAVPSDPVVNCINLPVFTFVEQIRPQPDSVIDRALIGMVINDFQLQMNSGPGRANCTMTVNCVGTGNYLRPSGSVIPALTQESFLNAASASIQIAGIDYTLSKTFNTLTFTYNNNVRLPSGYYPGSGTVNGYAIRGRMEYADRVIGLTFQARAVKGSPEFTQLVTNPIPENPIVITVTGGMIGAGPQTHQLSITAPRTVISAVTNGNADGIVTVDCTVTFLKPPTGDIITMSATTDKDAILGK